MLVSKEVQQMLADLQALEQLVSKFVSFGSRHLESQLWQIIFEHLAECMKLGLVHLDLHRIA